MRKKLLLLLVLLMTAWTALADQLPAPFTGYFDKTVFLRPSPAASSDSLATIPAGTPIELTPVDDRFARAEYQGRSGYIYYPGAKRMPVVKQVTSYLAYLPENKFLFALPLDEAAPLLTVQAETPVTVTGQTDRFLRIEAQGKTGYVYARDARAIDDMSMERTDAEFYAEHAVVTRRYPLSGAEKTLTLEAGRICIAEAVCNGYYRVTLGDDTVYVPVKSVVTVSQQKHTARAALITPDTQLFTAPKQSARASKGMTETVLMLLDAQDNGFQRLHGQNLYVRVNDVNAYAVSLEKGLTLRLLADAALLLQPEKGAPETVNARTGMLVSEVYGLEDWYLLPSGGRWGFIRRDDPALGQLRTDASLMPTAAVTEAKTTLLALSGGAVPLPAGTRLTLTESAGDFYRARANGREGYVLKRDTDILGSDTELTPYTITAPAAVSVLDFPDAALGREVFTIPAGEQVKVTGFNRCYLIVRHGTRTGYAPQKGLITAESEGIPATEDIPDYMLVLDKSTGMAYAFEKTAAGAQGQLIICAEVGIGKRTTPTPTGTFLLGRKERWHAFTLSYTPHTTEYVKARFIHGWPCGQKAESTVKSGLIRTGMVTGGCLRSPFAFARWVYMNCTSYETELTIVNGGFAAPENADTYRVQ